MKIKPFKFDQYSFTKNNLTEVKKNPNSKRFKENLARAATSRQTHKIVQASNTKLSLNGEE